MMIVDDDDEDEDEDEDDDGDEKEEEYDDDDDEEEEDDDDDDGDDDGRPLGAHVLKYFTEPDPPSQKGCLSFFVFANFKQQRGSILGFGPENGK